MLGLCRPYDSPPPRLITSWPTSNVNYWPVAINLCTKKVDRIFSGACPFRGCDVDCTKGYDAEIYGRLWLLWKKILLVVSMIKKEAKAFTKNGTDKNRLSAHKVVAGWLLLGDSWTIANALITGAQDGVFTKWATRGYFMMAQRFVVSIALFHLSV